MGFDLRSIDHQEHIPATKRSNNLSLLFSVLIDKSKGETNCHFLFSTRSCIKIESTEQKFFMANRHLTEIAINCSMVLDLS